MPPPPYPHITRTCYLSFSADAPGQWDSEDGSWSDSGFWKLYEWWKPNPRSSWWFQPRHPAQTQGRQEQCKRENGEKTIPEAFWISWFSAIIFLICTTIDYCNVSNNNKNNTFYLNFRPLGVQIRVIIIKPQTQTNDNSNKVGKTEKMYKRSSRESSLKRCVLKKIRESKVEKQADGNVE